MSDFPHNTPVILRNGDQAILTGSVDIWPFTMQGYRVDSPQATELWTCDGYWLETKRKHPFDVAHVITASGLHVPSIAVKQTP